jgi:flavin reductase (DIM6/NTAB) family NADH-FMN oxidoreductase RutF
LHAPINSVAIAYRSAMRRQASTVTIISTGSTKFRHGITATAMTSVSMEPPSLLACINRMNHLHGLLEEQENFCVNLLHSSHVKVSEVFSGQKLAKNRFEWGNWATHPTGLPYLADAQSNIFCRKTLSIPYGSHTIFVGEAFEVESRDEIAPLMYANGSYATCIPMGN